ncbi:glycoside hydrolase family 99-like domain-containing protein, partial [Acinetobacter baumannii]
MTSGWDKRPWGGSSDSDHDNSMGTADQFEQHLIAAKKRMDQFPAQTLKTGIICCWNEFGEGSFIEPTQQNGFDFL